MPSAGTSIAMQEGAAPRRGRFLEKIDAEVNAMAPRRKVSMELSQVALDTGLRLCFEPDSESDALASEVRAWLLDLVWSQRVEALPPRWSGFRANATDFGGGLVLTVYQEPDAGPLLTVGIARRASHGSPLWRVLTALPLAKSGLRAPPTPWCGVLRHGSDSAQHPLDDFIRACAWVWIQRPPPSRRSSSPAMAGASRKTLAGDAG
jgi:hypothetical protein